MENNRQMPVPEDMPVLDVPEQHEDKPAQEVQAPKPSLIQKKKLIVVATDVGYYNCNRIKEGEEFEINGEHELGSWMRAKDPNIQKRHEAKWEKVRENLRKIALKRMNREKQAGV